MSDYRFHPLRDYPRQGILQDVVKGTTHKAEFLTPSKAKARQLAKHRKEEIELLRRLKVEIKYASSLG